MSELKVNKLSPRSGTAVTLGDSGDTFTIPSGATLAIAGSVTGFTSAGIDDNATSVAITISSDEDVTFTEDILLGDDKKAIFGAGSDLQIYHDSISGHSFLKESGSGSLVVQTNNLVVQNAAGTANIINAPEGTAGLDLYYNGNTKLSTANNGVSVTGILSATNGNFGSNVNSQGTLNLSNNGAEQLEFFTGASSGLSQIQAFNRNDSTYDSLDFISLDTRFKISGTEKMRIDSSGNVGIGDTSPDGSLHITRSGSSLQTVLERTTSNTGKFGIGINSGLVFNDLVTSTERMRIDSSGNVAIGTTDTSHVGYTKTLNITSSNNTAIALQGGTSGVNAIFFGDGTGNPDFKRGVLYYYHSDNSMRFRTNDAERMRIDSSGNVGIAETSPQTTLHVDGTGALFESMSIDTNLSNVTSSFSRQNTGFNYRTTEGLNVTTNSNASASLNRKSDGRILDFFKNDTRKGSISIDDNGISISLGGTATANTLDDYEEGTWTPAYETTGTAFSSITYDAVRSGTYTKIGNTCYLAGILRTDAITKGSASGGIRITGLPFNVSGSTNSFNFAYVRNFLGEQPISGLGRSNDDTINIYFRTTSDGLTQPLQVSDMGTGSDDNEVYFSGTYITA